uniref:gastrula zinc finger protein XlCGF53.1-like isoform X2 n=1 Tax=Scatophagus argus TaxID=75038 RepID=UPI001ED81410|nr:gastrula zinc finger protein XlCGF53.1-like isoform X2 [Scatophagus argus]
MSSVEYLRQFVIERLTAAAEEIFGVFNKTIVEYEEEVDRQRRLLAVVWKPEIKLHRIELPQQHVCKEEELLTEQQLCNQERSSAVDQEDPEPPQIKEEEEELCTNQEGEQLVLKQETESFMLTPAYEENEQSEDQNVYLNPDETENAAQSECVVNMSVSSSVVSEANSDVKLLCNNSDAAESRDQNGGKHEDSQQHKSHKNVHNPSTLKTHSSSEAGKKAFICDYCGKDFKYKSVFQIHLRVHTGEKPFSCSSCGKRFSRRSTLNIHFRVHTGEKPYVCKTCGKRFAFSGSLSDHKRVHMGEKPYSCKTCGKGFRRSGHLTAHVRRAHRITVETYQMLTVDNVTTHKTIRTFPPWMNGEVQSLLTLRDNAFH